MQGKTHLLVGMAAGLAISTPVAAPLGIVLGAVGGLLPDIDHPNSQISHKIPLLRVLTFWIPHRTFTHSIFAAFLAFLPGLIIHPVLMAFGAGYALHIAADMMTNSGVPLLCPITRLRFYLLPRGIRVLTGGTKEMILRLGVIVVFGLLIVQVIPFWSLALTNGEMLQFAMSLFPF